MNKKIIHKHYFNIAYRNIKKYKTYSALNIIGLSVGLSCFYLIMLFVQNELSFDKFNERGNRIYRIATNGLMAGREVNLALTSEAIGSTLINEYPEINNMVRLKPVSNQKILFNVDNKKYYEDYGYYCDSTVFKVFSLTLLRGSDKVALRRPNSVIISENLNNKLFGKSDPLCKRIIINDKEYYVEGVFKNIPENSHIRYDFLIGYQYEEFNNQNAFMKWMNFNCYTYILLNESTNKKQFENKFALFVTNHFSDYIKTTGISLTLFLQPIKDIHLYSNLEQEAGINYSIKNIFILVVIALFIILIASLNYINLHTAKSENRSREVAILKVIGAQKSQILLQLLFESVFITWLAWILSIYLILTILSYFNQFIGRSLQFNYYLISISFLITTIIGAIVGIFPALYFSSFSTISILKKANHLSLKYSKSILRKGLIITQFIIAISMVTFTFVIYKQLDYIKYKDLGFQKDNILYIPFERYKYISNLADFKNAIRNIPGVIDCSLSSGIPGGKILQQLYKPEKAKEYGSMQTLKVDYDYFNTYNIKLLYGRNFSKEYGTDEEQSVILNKSAMVKYGLNDILQSNLNWYPTGNKSWKVIGIVDDFHLNSLHTMIEPMAFQIIPGDYEYISIRINPKSLNGMIGKIEDLYSKYLPNQQFEYSFLNDQLEKIYSAEMKLGEIVMVFTVISLLIASLGLLGLVSFITEKKAKENSIRKILGASNIQLFVLGLREYFVLLFISYAITLPIVYILARKWLNDFAYHSELNSIPFILGGMFTLVAVILIVTYHLNKVVNVNPIKYISTE